LARVVGVTQATASSLVEALVREGLVSHSPDENDRRAVQLTTMTADAAPARRWLADYSLDAIYLVAAQ
jgi:DNA-binding MarR family transcriptional regulator